MEQVFEKIEELLKENERVVVGIDGPCASGKTTLGKAIAEKFDCNLIHADDFFLRPEQRCSERYAEAGGNIDRERLWDEVLSPIIRREDFSYRPYACCSGELGDAVFVPCKQLYVVEGSYSQHPFFGKAMYTLRIFVDISPEKQLKRLKERNPEKLERFVNEWIPMENRYFETYSIREKAHLVLNMEKED